MERTDVIVIMFEVRDVQCDCAGFSQFHLLLYH